jgi:hypothetical protein
MKNKQQPEIDDELRMMAARRGWTIKEEREVSGGFMLTKAQFLFHALHFSSF